MDGDALAYRVAAATERETEWSPGEITLSTSLSAGKEGIDLFLKTWMLRHNAKSLRVAMSDQPWTFRMSVYKQYKMHRGDKRKPLGLTQLRQYLFDEHGATMQPGLEADDLMGLWMTDKYRDSGIIVSWDKDMRAVPGRFWVPATDDVEVRDEREADVMWMAQALSGDAADGYPGCKNVGVVRAKRILEAALAEADKDLAAPTDHLTVLWETVKKTFLKAGHTEEEALTSAHLARILRHGDYDLKEKKVRLWTPPGSPSSSPSTVTPPARVRARARKSSNGSRTKRAFPLTFSASPSRSVARRGKSYPRTGPTRR